VCTRARACMHVHACEGCMCARAHVHACMCFRVCACMHAHDVCARSAGRHACVGVFMHACVHAPSYTCMYVCAWPQGVYACTHACNAVLCPARTRVCVCVCLCMHIHPHIHTYVHIHSVHAYACIFLYTCARMYTHMMHPSACA
jgi:hypothetical protein